MESEFADRMKADAAFLPVVCFELGLLSVKKQFNWSEFYERLLTALKHPFPQSGSLADARKKVHTALSSRQTLAIIVDEAHHLIDGYSEDGVRSQSEVIKSMSQIFKVTWIFIGTYDLNPLVRYNGQLARRSRTFHMGRYRNTPKDRKIFLDILKALDSRLAAFLSFRLASHEELLYHGCLGLVGLLRDWLVRAYRNSLGEKEALVSLEALGEEEMDVLSLIEILEEVNEGEKDLDITTEDRNRLLHLLAAERPDTGKAKDEKEGGVKNRVRRTRPGRIKRRLTTGLSA
jgi:hypothetical protein